MIMLTFELHSVKHAYFRPLVDVSTHNLRWKDSLVAKLAENIRFDAMIFKIL